MSTAASSNQGTGMKISAASDQSRDKFKDDMISVGRLSFDARAREAEQYLMEDNEPVPEAHRVAVSTFAIYHEHAQSLSYHLRHGVELLSLCNTHMSSRPDALLGQGIRVFLGLYVHAVYFLTRKY